MAVEVASAFVTLMPSFRGGAAAISREMSGSTEKAGKQSGKRFGTFFAASSIAPLRAFGAVAVGLFAVDRIAGFFSSAVQGASDLEEAGNKIREVFGAATGQIQTFAGQGATELGQSKLALLDAAATFGVFGKAAGLAGQENAKFSKELVRLSTDLASFYNTSPEDAIGAIGAALRGESEPIRQYGVLLDDATLRQRALKLGLVETTKDALTPQQRVLAAHAEIMKQTNVAQGDFARTSGGLANQQRILSAQWTDLKARIGRGLLPVLTQLAVFANEQLLPGLTRFGRFLSTELGPAIDQAAKFFQDLFSGAESGGSRLSGMVARFRDLGQTLVTQVRPAVGPVMEGLRRIAVEVAPLLRAAGQLIVAAFTRLAQVATWLADRIGPHLVPIVTAAWKVVSSIVATAVRGLTGIIKTLTALLRGDWRGAWRHAKQALSDAASGIASIAKAIFGDLIPALLRGVGAWISGAFSAAWRLAKEVVSDAASAIASAFRAGMDRLANTARSALTTVVGWFLRLPSWILGVLGDLGGLLVDAGRSLIDGLLRGLRSKASEMLDYVRGLAQQVRDLWPFSPAKEGPLAQHPMEEAGANLMRGLAAGIAGEQNTVLAGMRRVAGLVADTSAATTQGAKTYRTPLQTLTLASPTRPSSGASLTFNVAHTTDPHAIAREALRLAAFAGAV